MNGTLTDLGLARIAREMEGISRAVASNAITVELAIERRDWDTVYEASEVVFRLTARLRELRRGLLAAGVT